MKFKKSHEHTLPGASFRHIPNKLKQYASNMFNSLKCKNMSHGGSDILRMMTCAHGDNWRRNHPKSAGKQHKK